jgi:MFS family permease
LLALFGATMGQGVVWYTGQFYALSFIQNELHIEISQANKIIMWALLFGTPLFILFGYLSDRVGRKWIMMTGMLLAVFSYRGIYDAMYQTGSVHLKTIAFTETNSFKSAEGQIMGDTLNVVTEKTTYADGTLSVITQKQKTSDPSATQKPTISPMVSLDQRSFWMLVLLVFVQVVFVTMVYGPIAAFLVEMFPTAIRYTSMSLPYHIGNGIFGGLLPAVATYLATKAKQANEVAVLTGNAMPYDKPYLEGLWYPIAIASVCFVIGVLYINGKDNRIND